MRRILPLLFLVTSGCLCGQSISGSIQGSVVDPSDLAVAGAKVTLTQVATGAQRSMQASERGDFYFGALQPGQYTISVEFSGFKTLQKEGLNLTAAESLSVGRLKLEVGAVSESVTVQAEGTAVQTASAERSGVVTSSQVDQIAIRGRNVISLTQLLPGVVFNDDGDVIDRNWNLNVNGNRRNTTGVSLDGMVTNAIGNNNNMMIMVSQDAISELKVLLSNYQAEYGRMSGASVHLVTKSGTRDFHGGFSYYKRHEQFNANEFFNNWLGLPKPRYRYNTYNYNVGGPVTIPGKVNTNRDKLFFFWSQEFWPLRTPQAIRRLTVPTELERAGNFSQSLDVNNRLISIRDSSTGNPFPGNLVPASRIDPNGKALLSIFPAPNFLDRGVSGGNYNFIFQDENQDPKRTSTLKVDYHLNSDNIVSLNFGEHSDVTKGSAVGNSLFWGILYAARYNIGKSLIGNYKRIISPTLLNELNIGFIRRPNNEKEYEPTLPKVQRDKVGFNVGQFNSKANPLNVLPQAIFTGVPNYAQIAYDGRFPLKTTQDILTVNDSMSKMLSTHAIKAGFYYDHNWRGASSSNTIFPGEFDFGRDANSPIDSGYAYANTMLGIFRSYTESTARIYAEWRLSNIEWYAQDRWKLTPGFTLDYGMRFMIVVPIFERDNLVAGFVPSRWDPARKVQLIQPALIGGKRVGVHPVTGQNYPANLIGFIAPGTGDEANGMVSPSIDRSFPRGLVNNRGVQYAPRFGFAWDVLGDNRTALRGGFGVFYNRQHLDGQILSHADQPPLVQNPVINFGTLGTFLNSAGLISPQNVLGIDTIGKLPTVYNYSFTIQRDLGLGTVVDLGYVGNLGRHLMWQRDLSVIPAGANFNPANIDPTTRSVFPRQFLVRYTGYNNVNYREWASSSNYHSLQVTANRRFARGLQFGAAWTWSKSMDYNSGDTNAISQLVPVRIWNYGLSDHDRTHVLKLNWLWDIPRAAMPNVVLDRMVNGWQLSGIASFVSGSPLSVGFSTTRAVDITGTPSQGARIVVLDNPVLPKGDRTFDRFFNTNVFALPAVGTFGNAARTLLRGPGINNWDVALYKSVELKEAARIQFRFETYNTFNHTQFSGVDTGARFDPSTGAQVNARMGQMTSARPGRRIQLALRFLF